MSRRWLLVAMLALLVVSGCSDAGGEEAVDRERLSDLDRALWERTEELTVECMQEAGFEYVPRAYPGKDTLRFAGSPFELTEDEVAERGFGFTDQVIAGAADLRAGGDVDDANEQVQDALPESQQVPWTLALEGSPERSAPGCRSRAQGEADAEFADEITELVTRTAEAGEQIEADPRFAELWEEWSDCMADLGFAARDLEDLQMSLMDEASALVTLPVPEDPADLDDGSFDDRVEIDLDEASEVREREIAAATASVACLEPLEEAYLAMVEDALDSHD